MDIGGELRRTRTAKNLTLAEISRRTKITPTLLRAIENNRFDRVPGGLFTRAFLRAYAREVDLDPEPIVQRYRAEFETPEVPDDVDERKQSAQAHVDFNAFFESRRGAAQTIGLVVVAFIGLVYLGFFHDVAPQSTPISLKPTDSVQTSASAVVPVPTTGSLDPVRDVPHVADLKLEIQATGECWVAASADGKRVIARLMNAGERQQFDIREQLLMRVGDPSALTLTINGAAARSLGPPGTAVNVQINRQNYKTFLPL